MLINSILFACNSMAFHSHFDTGRVEYCMYRWSKRDAVLFVAEMKMRIIQINVGSQHDYLMQSIFCNALNHQRLRVTRT